MNVCEDSLSLLLSSSSQDSDTFTQCLNCTFIATTGKISNSDVAWHRTENNNCTGHCVDCDDALGTFTDAFLSLLIYEEFSESHVRNIEGKLQIFLESVLDKTGRLQFFLSTLVSMEQVSTSDDKDKIITFLSNVTSFLESDSDLPNIHS